MKLKIYCYNTSSYMTFEELKAYGEANNLVPLYSWDNGYSSWGCDKTTFEHLERTIKKWENMEHIATGRFANNPFSICPEKQEVRVSLVSKNYERQSTVSFS